MIPYLSTCRYFRIRKWMMRIWEFEFNTYTSSTRSLNFENSYRGGCWMLPGLFVTLSGRFHTNSRQLPRPYNFQVKPPSPNQNQFARDLTSGLTFEFLTSHALLTLSFFEKVQHVHHGTEKSSKEREANHRRRCGKCQLHSSRVPRNYKDIRL